MLSRPVAWWTGARGPHSMLDGSISAGYGGSAGHGFVGIYPDVGEAHAAGYARQTEPEGEQ